MECGIGVIVDGSTGPVRTVATLAVPPRDAPAATSRRSGGRPTLSWQHFEDPSGHGGLKTLQKEPLAGGHRKYIHI
jgi:hypothetical protein